MSLGEMMARAAGWGSGMSRSIECKESGTPFRDEPDLRSVAVLYVTREEASVIADLARELQAARASGANQFLVRKSSSPYDSSMVVGPSGATGLTGATGPVGATGYTGGDVLYNLQLNARFQPGRLPPGWMIDFNVGNNQYFLCDETRSVRAKVARVSDTMDDWVIVWVFDKPPPKPTGVVMPDGSRMKCAALFQLNRLPLGWAINFDAGKHYLCDETRAVRAEVSSALSSDDWIMVRVVETTELTTAKPVSGDAARFAGIDFND